MGLDLSNFSYADGFEWWDKDPVVEYALYDDNYFRFSTATRRQVQQAAADHPAPWTGHRLAGPHGTIGVRGLRALNGALLRNEAGRPWDFGADGRSYDDEVAMVLGGWWLVLRFHQAVARAWPEVGPVARRTCRGRPARHRTAGRSRCSRPGRRPRPPACE